ncbi:purine nucleoside permease [Neokomagataea tanensis]|uniref:Purine nucleoside permease n=1 Tax=Neokomagataea tanensis TaxID=661191 RepID=A0A4Y6VC73_9PROT|nr:purine nucleoside permease [Neokomagataea tanensis]
MLPFLTPDLCHAQTPWPVRVVIVTTFENGADKGDKPGELQLWAEREHLTETISFPGNEHPILSNPEHTEIAIVTGMSLVNAGPSVMALGTDPRFDLTHSYWLVAGIAGIDPKIAPLGSAAWARYVINDVAQSIDSREIPKDWPYGIYPAGAKRPASLNGADVHYGPNAPYPIVFPLNAQLAHWAFEETKQVPLMDTPEMRAYSAGWSSYEATKGKPKVIEGDSFASDLYWHGNYLNQYARDWVKMFTAGKGIFAMSNMEDSAIAASMVRLDHMHKADFKRLMILRTASNYTVPPTGKKAYQSVEEKYPDEGLPAYDAAWHVGSIITHKIMNNWDTFKDNVPD